MGGFGGNTGGFGAGGFGNSLGGTTRPISYYVGLLTSQYQNSPKLLQWLATALQYVDDVSSLLDQFGFVFDIDSAEGAQLDVLGVLVGVNRTVNFQPNNGVSPVLDDDTYRILLKARIGRNQWNGQIDSLVPLWQKLFPGGIITVLDNENMSINVFCAGAFTSIIKDLINNDYIIPRPMGVLLNISFAVEPIFGFSRNDNFIAGFDLGHFA